MPDPFTLEGFVQPEDLGMHGRPFQSETKASTIMNAKNNKPKKDINSKIKKGNRITMQHPSLLNVDPTKHKDTEMRISISK